MKKILVLIVLLFASISLAEQGGWFDSYGNVVSDSESKKWLNGFGGWLIVTSDEDWKDKWNNPKGGTPVFSEVTNVELGEEITILTLYKNPLVDEQNRVNITCDIKVVKPDGTSSYEESDIACAREELVGYRGNIRLSNAIIDFVGELGDPYGVWSIEVVLKDNNAQITIPLRSQFELINTTTMTLQRIDHAILLANI